MVYSRDSVPCKSEFLRRTTYYWRWKWMSYPHTFLYYSVSMSWTMRNSWRTIFRTSYRQQIMVGQCPSLVSMDTFTSLGIRNQYFYQVGNCHAASSLQASYLIVQSYETCTTEPSWSSYSTTVGNNYQGVWNLSKFQRSSTTLSILATAIRYCFKREVALDVMCIEKRQCYMLLTSRQNSDPRLSCPIRP